MYAYRQLFVFYAHVILTFATLKYVLYIDAVSPNKYTFS